MPDSLMNMFQPNDPLGQPTDVGNAFTSRSNSLIGLGMGLLSPYRPSAGESPWVNALQGLQAGSAADLGRAKTEQQIRMEKARLQLAREQANKDPEAIRQLRAAGVPQEKWADYLYPKQDEWKAGSVTYREQEYPYRANLRTGQYEWGPMGPPPGLNAARPAAPAAANPYAGGAAVPFVGGRGAPSSAGVLPAAPSTTGMGTAAPATSAGAVPPPLPGMEEELPSVQKAIRTKQLEDYSKTQLKDPVQTAAAQKSAADVLTALDTAEKQAINKGGLLPTTGILGGKLTQVYQPSADLSATLNTIAANISLDKLNAMRQASTSGASGLGAVTEPEHRMLMNSIAALEQSQGQDQLLANLKRVRATYDWIINRTDKNQPPPFSLRPDASQPATTGGTGGVSGTTKSGIKWTVD